MELYQLQYFVTLCDAKTYTAAAINLHISQPSLSIAIKKLETSLGFKLIDRSKKQLFLTKEGELLYQKAKDLLMHYNYVADEVGRLKTEGHFEISLSMIESTKFWMPKIIQHYQALHHHSRIKISDILALNQVIKALEDYEIDFAITNQYINQTDIETVPLYTEALVAVLPLDHPMIEADSLPLEALEDEPFIICKTGFQTREDILTALSQNSISPQINTEIGRFETAISLVNEKIGMTVLPLNYAKFANLNRKQIKSFNNIKLERTVYLAYKQNRYMPTLIKDFIDMITDHFEGANNHDLLP